MAVLIDDAKVPSFLADRAAFRLNTRMEGPELSKLVRAVSNPRTIPQYVPIDKEHVRQRKERLSYIGKAAESLKAD